MTQSQKILRRLMSGLSITAIDALNEFDCFRLSARINELRGQGYNIITLIETSNGKSYARYYMPLHHIINRPQKNNQNGIWRETKREH